MVVDSYYVLFYKFTLSEDAVVSFGSDFDEAVMGENLSYFELDLIADKYRMSIKSSK